LRPCRISWLNQAGDCEETRILIPALPAFEAAFCAFARGTLVDTPNGPTAIEDLLPGDLVLTADGGTQPITWIGTTTLVPTGGNPDLRAVSLHRVMTDAFGMSRPMSYMVTGPSARILSRSGQVLMPISAFEDGVQVTALTPPSPVEMFNICLPMHAMIRAGGLEMESYHPGHGALRELGPAMRDLFMKLFPQLGHITDFGGMIHPREPDQTDGTHAA
jgi:hypothetical protein